jgi:hypothetical protein
MHLGSYKMTLCNRQSLTQRRLGLVDLPLACPRLLRHCSRNTRTRHCCRHTLVADPSLCVIPIPRSPSQAAVAHDPAHAARGSSPEGERARGGGWGPALPCTVGIQRSRGHRQSSKPTRRGIPTTAPSAHATLADCLHRPKGLTRRPGGARRRVGPYTHAIEMTGLGDGDVRGGKEWLDVRVSFVFVFCF